MQQMGVYVAWILPNYIVKGTIVAGK